MDLASLDAGHTGFLQDPTGGIALYLDTAAPHALAAGSIVRVAGTVDTRYGLTILRVTMDAIEMAGSSALPPPATVATGAADARYEGARVTVAGRVTSAPSEVADGTSLEVDDGSGPVRVIVDPAVYATTPVVRGDDVVATGPLGRRDSGGTAVFRVHVTLPGSLGLAAPQPSPTASPAPGPTSTPAPTATPGPTPTPTPTPTATPTSSPEPTGTPGPSAEPLTSIAAALAEAPGTRVRVRGVVTAVPGGLWTATIGAIQDDTAALVVRYRGDAARPVLDGRIEVTGTLLRSGSRLVLRADEPWTASDVGSDELADPTPMDPGRAIDATADARLAAVEGTVVKGSVRRSGARITFQLLTADGVRLGVTAPAVAAVAPAPANGEQVRVTGVGVPGTSGTSTAAGRIWLRRSGDLVRVASAAAAGPSPATSSAPVAGTPSAAGTGSTAGSPSPAAPGGGVTAAGSSAATSASGSARARAASAGPTGGSSAPVGAPSGAFGLAAAASTAVPAVTARALAAAAAGAIVTVAGIVRGAGPSQATVLLEDTTGIVRLRLEGIAASFATVVGPGDALSATGTTARVAVHAGAARASRHTALSAVARTG